MRILRPSGSRHSTGPSLLVSRNVRSFARRPADSVREAASAFFTKASEKPKALLRWSVRHDSLLVGKYDGEKLSALLAGQKVLKLASFDLDGTLISTQSGNRFAKDAADWKFFSPKVPKLLRELHDAGHLVVIFSNQAGIKIADAAKKYTTFKAKIDAITRTLSFPLFVFAATAHDQFRKPRMGMFHELQQELGDGAATIDLAQSFFVGDAAGRIASPSSPVKDFADSDRKFAINCNLKFYTPDEYFLSHPSSVEYVPVGFDPKKFQNPEYTDYLFERLAPLEIILFVGSPASGKSTFYEKVLKPFLYSRVNQDMLKSRQRCLQVAKEELQNGNSVVVDNTNATIETRASWLALAKEFGIPARVVHFTSDVDMCQHNNCVRAFCPRDGEEKRDLLPAMAFTSFKSRYQAPQIEEGFLRVDEVEFVFSGSAEELSNWRKYWL